MSFLFIGGDLMLLFQPECYIGGRISSIVIIIEFLKILIYQARYAFMALARKCLLDGDNMHDFIT